MFHFLLRYTGDVSSMLLVLIPELVFMLSLFGYLVFMVVFKWIAFGPQDSDRAPSILIHFIDMFVFGENPDNPPLYPGQVRFIQYTLILVSCFISYYSFTAVANIHILSLSLGDSAESIIVFGAASSSGAVTWKTALPVLQAQE